MGSMRAVTALAWAASVGVTASMCLPILLGRGDSEDRAVILGGQAAVATRRAAAADLVLVAGAQAVALP
jgi:hypothetical protein